MVTLERMTREEAEEKYGAEALQMSNPFDVGLVVADEDNPSANRHVLAIDAEDVVLDVHYVYDEIPEHVDWESDGIEILVDLYNAGMLPEDIYLRHLAVMAKSAVAALDEKGATRLFNSALSVSVSRRPGFCPWDKDIVEFALDESERIVRIIGIGVLA